MKKPFISMILAWLFVCNHAFADQFQVSDFTIAPGETKTISLELENTERNYIAFEFFLMLPDGISIDSDEYGSLDVALNSERISRHVLEVEQNDEGYYHFLCYSNRNNVFKNNHGEILSMKVKADPSLSDRVMAGKIVKQKLSDADGQKVMFDDFYFNITVNTSAPSSVAIAIPDNGATTCCMKYGLDFSGVTGLKAYVATLYDGERNAVVMKQVTEAPAGMGLYLVGNPGEHNVPVRSTRKSYADLMVGTSSGMTIPATVGDYTNLTLSTSDGSTFTSVSSYETVASNSAWLQLPTALYDGRSITIDFEEETFGDINMDGAVSITDAVVLINMILGKE